MHVYRLDELSDRAVEGHARAASNGPRTPDILRAPTKHRRRYSMPPLRRPRHGLQPDRRRAPELLAASRDGATEAIMIARGLSVEQMVELVRDGLAAATARRIVAGKNRFEVVTLRITDAGRRASSTKRHQ